jgi:hypothetical protein
MLKSVKVVSFGLMSLLLIAVMVSFINGGSNANATLSQMPSGKTTVFWSTPTPTKNQSPTPTKNQSPTPSPTSSPTPTKNQSPTPSPTSSPPGPPGLPPTGSDPNL